MIQKEELKDWLKEAERKKSINRIKEYIDSKIKNNDLAGRYTSFVSTGKYIPDGSRKTSLFDIWYDPSLSSDNQLMVHKAVIKKHKDNGFNVAMTNYDCGWDNLFKAIEFTHVDKVVEDSE